MAGLSRSVTNRAFVLCVMAGLLAAPASLWAQGKTAALSGSAAAAVGKKAQKDDRPVLNRLAAVGDLVKDPVAEAKREIGASCLKIEYPKEFVRWHDINGDEIPDALINFDVVCDGYRGAFCGVRGCAGRVFVSDGKDLFRKTSLPSNVKPRAPFKGLPAVVIAGRGAECGHHYYVDAECETPRVWNGRDFIDPETLTEEGRKKAAETMAASVQEAVAREAAAEQAEARAEAENDATVTAALFSATAPEDEAWKKQLAEAQAAGAIEVLDPIRAEIPGEIWSYEPLSEGRARAWMESDYGYASLQLACRAGDETIGVAFSGEHGNFAPGAGYDGQLAETVMMISGRVRAKLTMTYVAANDFWVARVPPEGALIYWLRRGSNVLIWNAEDDRRRDRPGGRFGLRGSRDAVEASLRACGKTPSVEPPENAGVAEEDGGYGYQDGYSGQRRPSRWRRRYDDYGGENGWSERRGRF